MGTILAGLAARIRAALVATDATAAILAAEDRTTLAGTARPEHRPVR